MRTIFRQKNPLLPTMDGGRGFSIWRIVEDEPAIRYNRRHEEGI
jgi:hypothetical protein